LLSSSAAGVIDALDAIASRSRDERGMEGPWPA